MAPFVPSGSNKRNSSSINGLRIAAIVVGSLSAFAACVAVALMLTKRSASGWRWPGARRNTRGSKDLGYPDMSTINPSFVTGSAGIGYGGNGGAGVVQTMTTNPLSSSDADGELEGFFAF